MCMTIDKAIEVLSCLLADRQDLQGTDIANSIKLLIEAGKWYELIKPTLPALSHKLLPGETEGGSNETDIRD